MADSSLVILLTAKDEASKVFKSAGGEVEGFGNKLKGAATALGTFAAGFLSFRALEGAIDATKELGAEVRTLSRETGLGAEDASRFIFAIKELGLAPEDASRSLGILSKNLVNTRDTLAQGKDATSPFANSMRVLGVAFIQADGNVKPLNQVLLDLADRFKAMPNGVEKTARAIDIFGRSGKDMLPVLNLGSEGIKELAAEADKLGVVLSAENAENIRKYTRAQREFNEAMLGIKVTIGEAVIPALTSFSQWFTDHQTDVRQFVQDSINAIGTFATDFNKGMSRIQTALDWIPTNQGRIIAAIAAIGAALVLALGPTSAAFLAVTGIVALLGALDSKTANPMSLGEAIVSGKASPIIQDMFKKFPQDQQSLIKGYGILDSTQSLLRATGLAGFGGNPVPPKPPGEEPPLKLPDFPHLGEETKKLIDIFREQGDALRGALSKVSEAIGGLFSRPTREQLNLEDKIAEAKARGPGVHFGPGFIGTSEQLAAKFQKQADLLQSAHDKERKRLEGLDQTILSEAELKTKTEQLAAIIPGYTQNIKDSATALGVNLTPGFDDLVRSSDALTSAFTGPLGLVDAALKAVDALRNIADINSKPLRPTNATGGVGNAPYGPFQDVQP